MTTTCTDDRKKKKGKKEKREWVFWNGTAHDCTSALRLHLLHFLFHYIWFCIWMLTHVAAFFSQHHSDSNATERGLRSLLRCGNSWDLFYHFHCKWLMNDTIHGNVFSIVRCTHIRKWNWRQSASKWTIIELFQHPKHRLYLCAFAYNELFAEAFCSCVCSDHKLLYQFFVCEKGTNVCRRIPIFERRI